MKVFILFLFFSCSISSYTQTKISVKLHLIHRDGSEQIHIKKNFEDFLEIFADVATTISVKEEDVLFFYINDELVEHIEISKNIIDRKQLYLTLSYGTILEEIKIDKTSLTKSLGLGSGISYTKQERAVRFDNQLFNNEGLLVIDGLINKISGRAKINNKALAMDVEFKAMQRFLSVYTPDFLYENYKLPKEQAPYFALNMVRFINTYTNLQSLDFKEIVKQEILKFTTN